MSVNLQQSLSINIVVGIIDVFYVIEFPISGYCPKVDMDNIPTNEICLLSMHDIDIPLLLR